MTVREMKERERLAYITGKVEEAKMWGMLIEAYQGRERYEYMAWR